MDSTGTVATVEPILWSPTGSVHGLGNACKSKGKKVKCKGKEPGLCYAGSVRRMRQRTGRIIQRKEKYEEHGEGVPDDCVVAFFDGCCVGSQEFVTCNLHL